MNAPATVRRTVGWVIAGHGLFALVVLALMHPRFALPAEVLEFAPLASGASLSVLLASWITLGTEPPGRRWAWGIALEIAWLGAFLLAEAAFGNPPSLKAGLWTRHVLGGVGLPFVAALLLGTGLRSAGWRWIVAPPGDSLAKPLSLRDLFAATAFLAATFAVTRWLLTNYQAVERFQAAFALYSQLGRGRNDAAFALLLGLCNFLSYAIAGGSGIGPRTHPLAVGAAVLWAIGSTVGWLLVPPTSYAIEGSAVLGGAFTVASLLALRSAGMRIDRPAVEPVIAPTNAALGE